MFIKRPHILCYAVIMKNIYRRTATTVSFINYHFVFCPYRRRKIFDIPGVEFRFKELVSEICTKNGIEILAMECHHAHVHLFVSALPQLSIPDIMQLIKGGTSAIIRKEFPVLAAHSGIWTRSYFVSTAGTVSASTIQHYVETQKTR